MSARWNANTVLLAVFVLILVGAGVDYGRRVLGGPKPKPEAAPTTAKNPAEPDFKVGDPAPDFALPDSKKKMRKLSELVDKKTLLFFACGCSNCRQIQSLLADMRRNKPGSVPPVITITSAPPEAEEAWLRDTKLEQTMLYHRAGVSPDPMTIYRGKPCPRLYIVNADRTVKFIGMSPSQMAGMYPIGAQIAKELGTQMPGSANEVNMRMKSQPKEPDLPERAPGLPPYALSK